MVRTKTMEELTRELNEARRKFENGDLMSHHECLIMYVRQEMSCKQFCERDVCLTERWYLYLQLMGKERPGTDLDAENFFLFIADWVNDPVDGKQFWNADFDMATIFDKYKVHKED